MRGKRLIIGLIATSVGCSGGDGGDSGSDEMGLSSCGIGIGSVFELEISRVTLAPADQDGMQWDGTQPTSRWRADLKEWRDLSATVSTQGAFERGSYEDVETLNAYFESSLYEPTAAPDPIVSVYTSNNGGKRWSEAQTWNHFEGNTHQLSDIYLGRFTLDDRNLIDLRISDADAPDETRVGDLAIDGVLAQSIADCGDISVVLSDEEMQQRDSWIHAIELRIIRID